MDEILESNVCRLCLDVPEHFEILGNLERNMLNDILPDVNINPLAELYICKVCSTHLLQSYQFKHSSLEASANADGLIKPEIVSPASLEHTLMDTGYPLKQEDALDCCLCQKTIEREACNALIPSEILQEMLEKCLPELEDGCSTAMPTACEKCTCSLESMFTFINVCLEVERKIKKYCITKAINSDGYINLYEIRYAEIEMVDVKDHIDVCFDDNSYNSLIKLEPQFECDEGMTEIHGKDATSIRKPELNLEISKETQYYSSTPCVSATDVEDPLEIQKPTRVKHKCEQCPYETPKRSDLHRHMLRHKKPSEVTMHKCELCDFKTKHKGNLKHHMLNHKNLSEIKIYKCDECEFQAKLKGNLKKHMIKHKNPSELTMIRCVLCSYETKYNYNLKAHMLVHKGSSETQMYHCTVCSYKTKYERYLKVHDLTHKKGTERHMFRCAHCPHETKHKRSLKSHLVTRHKKCLVV